MENYLNQKIKFTGSSLLSEDGFTPIMMDWETDMMRKTADLICSKGGDVLNIGFGMGIVDGFIEDHDILTHTIIEPHPIVIEKMRTEGWFERNRVKILQGKWQDFLDSLDKFDAVYYDTSPAESELESIKFYKNVHNIIKPGGIFSFFNGSFYNPNTKNLPNFIYDIISENFEIKTEKIIMDLQGYDLNLMTKYWSPYNKKCWVPICIRK